ncbi:tetratricopeptide repeat protein [Psychroserpens luteolus]|uniref:tetratricopeptide repeat protein n=1 Tax=Psychroserpens luteolus TaxID=2855840 RepID=UPI001E315E96|nr:hypothetical protein [Psychroserpens luteolus]MCD2260075.1 hypothetical protein [Psychroserpens luteolus]
MKRIILLCLFLCTQFINGQTFDFETTENDIKNHINKNEWDEVLLLAPDLLIANPNKGEGYYYTAYAFFKLEQKQKALQYLNKARLIADDELTKKINELDSSINQSSKAKNTAENAKSLEDNNQSDAAAQQWESAWQEDKSNLEYGLNAVQLYIEQKEYKKAITILKDDAFKNEIEAQNIIKKLNQTPEISSENTYTDAIKLGDEYYNKSKFSDAINEYQKALNSGFNNQVASDKINDSKEERLWQEANISNEIQIMEDYADKYPRGKHISNAKSIISNSYKSIAKDAFEKSNESKLLKYYDKYKKRFPNDDSISTINQYVQDYYFSLGKENLKNKQWTSTITYFNGFLKYSNSEENNEVARKGISKSTRRLKRRSSGFLSGVYELDENFGLSFGKLNHRGLGWYANLRVNPTFVTEANFEKSDNTLTEIPNEAKEAIGSLSIGTSFPVLYPIWIYIGGGASYRERLIDNDGEPIYFSIEGEKNINYFPEAGIMIRLGGIIISGGASYLNEELIIQGSFGVKL